MHSFLPTYLGGSFFLLLDVSEQNFFSGGGGVGGNSIVFDKDSLVKLLRRFWENLGGKAKGPGATVIASVQTTYRLYLVNDGHLVC